MPMDNVLFKCPVLNTATENATQIDFLSVSRYFLNIYFLTFIKWLLYCFRFVPGKHFCFLFIFPSLCANSFFSQINFNWRPLKIEAQSKINTILIICIPLPVSLSIGIAFLDAFFFKFNSQSTQKLWWKMFRTSLCFFFLPSTSRSSSYSDLVCFWQLANFARFHRFRYYDSSWFHHLIFFRFNFDESFMCFFFQCGLFELRHFFFFTIYVCCWQLR